MASPTIDINRPPFRLPSRVFMYGMHIGPDGKPRSAAAVGHVNTASFDVAHVYRPGFFGPWVGAYDAARAGVHWLLFLNHDGQAATGTIDGNFNFIQAKAYPPGQHASWMRAVVDGNGELLLTSGLADGRTRIGFGQVDPDGTFIVWWQTEIALGYPDRLLGLGQVHAWLRAARSGPASSTVSLLHRGAIVGSRTWNENWTGMAAHGDLLALYRGIIRIPITNGEQILPQRIEVCRVGADHSITTIWSYADFPPKIDDANGGDIDTPTGSLFYQFATGSNVAEVRSLTDRGFVRTAALGQILQSVPDIPNPGLGWFSIARC